MSGAIKGGRPKGEPIYFRRGGAKVTAHRETRTAVEELIAATPDASPLIADLLRGTADIADTARRRLESLRHKASASLGEAKRIGLM